MDLLQFNFNFIDLQSQVRRTYELAEIRMRERESEIHASHHDARDAPDSI